MQSSKTSKQSRKSAAEPTTSAEAALANEGMTATRKPRASQSKSSISEKPAVAPTPTAAAKSHRRTPSSRVTEPEAQPVVAVPVKVMAAAAAAEPVAVERFVTNGATHEEIATRAYFYWLERGGHHGTAHDDWARATRDLSKRN